jgi:hypothetical protein
MTVTSALRAGRALHQEDSWYLFLLNLSQLQDHCSAGTGKFAGNIQ